MFLKLLACFLILFFFFLLFVGPVTDIFNQRTTSLSTLKLIHSRNETSFMCLTFADLLRLLWGELVGRERGWVGQGVAVSSQLSLRAMSEKIAHLSNQQTSDFRKQFKKNIQSQDIQLEGKDSPTPTPSPSPSLPARTSLVVAVVLVLVVAFNNSLSTIHSNHPKLVLAVCARKLLLSSY